MQFAYYKFISCQATLSFCYVFVWRVYKHGFLIHFSIIILRIDFVITTYICMRFYWIHYLTNNWRSVMLYKCWSNVKTSKRCVLTTYSNLETRTRIYCKSIKDSNCHRNNVYWIIAELFKRGFTVRQTKTSSIN